MDFMLHAHRHADVVIEAEAPEEWRELTDAIRSIQDHDIVSHFRGQRRKSKSISEAVNSLLKQRLVELGWLSEAAIFQDEHYREKRWRLDFAKGMISVEVAFNHAEAIAWNLLKPVLASEFNHVRKAIQTRFGVVICATQSLKAAGGFDGAVGTFEQFARYLKPLQNPLSVPLMLLGLRAPESFVIEHTREGRRSIGRVVELTHGRG